MTFSPTNHGIIVAAIFNEQRKTMNTVNVKVWTDFKHSEGLPVYETQGAAAMDVRANIKVCIQPKETVLIPTGIFMSIPEGYEVQVRPRSGLSLKTKFRIANAPGTIDSDYLGELCIIAENTHSAVEMNFTLGERVAQILIAPVYYIAWNIVAEKSDLGKTARGENGFGSTGT